MAGSSGRWLRSNSRRTIASGNFPAWSLRRMTSCGSGRDGSEVHVTRMLWSSTAIWADPPKSLNWSLRYLLTASLNSGEVRDLACEGSRETSKSSAGMVNENVSGIDMVTFLRIHTIRGPGVPTGEAQVGGPG